MQQRAISSLEKKVGNALLYRSTRKLSLTHEGKILFEHATAMLEHAQSGLNKITPKYIIKKTGKPDYKITNNHSIGKIVILFYRIYY